MAFPNRILVKSEQVSPQRRKERKGFGQEMVFPNRVSQGEGVFPKPLSRDDICW
jgi:hypothetical protein